MRVVVEQRASSVIYNLVKTRIEDGKYLLPANICPIVPLTFFAAGKHFEFIDIDPQTLCLSHSAVEQQLANARERVSGVLFARTYGVHTNFEPMFARWKAIDPECLIIDDRCLCIADIVAPAASSADAILYSTGDVKFAELGHGGYAFLDEQLQYERWPRDFDPADHERLVAQYKAALERQIGFVYSDSNWLDTRKPEFGWPEYRDRIQQCVEQAADQRMELVPIYSNVIPERYCLPPAYQDWRFNITVTRRDEILARIFESGGFASAHYQSLCGIMGSGTDTVARKLAGEVLNLFIDKHYTAEKAENTAKIIKQELGQQ